MPRTLGPCCRSCAPNRSCQLVGAVHLSAVPSEAVHLCAELPVDGGQRGASSLRSFGVAQILPGMVPPPMHLQSRFGLQTYEPLRPPLHARVALHAMQQLAREWRLRGERHLFAQRSNGVGLLPDLYVCSQHIEAGGRCHALDTRDVLRADAQLALLVCHLQRADALLIESGSQKRAVLLLACAVTPSG